MTVGTQGQRWGSRIIDLPNLPKTTLIVPIVERQAIADAAEFVAPDPVVTVPLGAVSLAQVGPSLATDLTHRRPTGWAIIADDRGRRPARESMSLDEPDGRLGARAGLQRVRRSSREACSARHSRMSTAAGWRSCRHPGCCHPYEMVHETRMIPLDRRPHVSLAIRSYMGDARGPWDGQTLVAGDDYFNA